MTKKLFAFLLSFFLFLPIKISFAATDKHLLVLDVLNDTNLPRHYRATTHSFTAWQVSTRGLRDLHMLGSGQFSEGQLCEVINTLGNAPIAVIDLRKESHAFIDGNAVSWHSFHNWANKDITDQMVEIDQDQHINALREMATVTVAKIPDTGETHHKYTAAIELAVKDVSSEEDIAQKNKLLYQRIYVNDHMAPQPAEVDRFISYVNSLPKDTWLYLHCRGGDGRTTTFMAMVDMMRNAKQVSLRDIIKRQYLLGGIDLFQLPHPNEYKYKYAVERVAFLKEFYNFCLTNQDNFNTPWAKYVSLQSGNKKLVLYSKQLPEQWIPLLDQKAGTDPYQRSIPLLVAAMQNNKAQYNVVLPEMLNNLGIRDPQQAYTLEEIEPFVQKKGENYTAWLLGRILLSAKLMHDSSTANKVSLLMQTLLDEAPLQVDAYQAWAQGYLATFFADTEQYTKYRQRMLTATDAIKSQASASDLTWARLVDLQAAAIAKDNTTYRTILHTLQNDHATLHEALSKVIPKNDYRSWAISLARLAAAEMSDFSTYRELSNALEITLDKDLSSQHNNLADNALTLATMQLAEQQLPVGEQAI